MESCDRIVARVPWTLVRRGRPCPETGRPERPQFLAERWQRFPSRSLRFRHVWQRVLWLSVRERQRRID